MSLRLIIDAAQRGATYLESMDARRVGPSPLDLAGLAHLGGPLPAGPTDPATVLADLDRYGSPATIANSSGRYFGFVNGGSLPAARAANVLAAAWDQNVALRAMSPVSAFLEDLALEWSRDLLGLPAGSAGALVTGATMANLTGLAAARQHLLAAQGWNAQTDGLFGAPPLSVIVSDESHISVRKALALLGLGGNRVTRVPTDSHGRLRADLLPPIEGPTIVCLQAGNVNTGAFDPARALTGHPSREQLWLHVDGAFGLWAAASPRTAHLMDGFADCDSWCTDGHKWLNVPYDCGFAFVRHPEALFRSMNFDAAYLQQSGDREPMQWGPEMSRRARGIEVWAALRSLGRSGVADLIDRTCAHARRFAHELRAAGAEILNDVVINQVLVRFGSDELTRALVAALQADGTCWCGGTVWQGRAAMRISVSSWATTDDDVDRSLAAMLRLWRQLA